MVPFRSLRRLRWLFASFIFLGSLSAAQRVTTASRHSTLPLAAVDELRLAGVDRELLRAQDEWRERAGLAPRYAVPNEVALDPFTRGTFESLPGDVLLWRLRIAAPGARSINLGFEHYRMPEGGRLLMYSPLDGRAVRPFTSADNEEHGELWTPILPGEELVLELTLPAEALDELKLELAHVGYGYRGFVEPEPFASGPCNVDVVCPIADDWRDEIPAVGVISTGGSTFCTGFLVNNTAQDRRPYFMTAAHCGIDFFNAASLVVYWNYETSTCGGPPDGQLDEFNTGSFFRAAYTPSDFTLVELDDAPDSAFGLAWAGWDKSGADATSAVAIHHPNTDEKRISFENQATTTTSYAGASVPGDGTHVRVIDWDVGTTEAGSSGSPLFDQDHRVIGQLHGGFALCGNDDSDWYGKFSVSWTGGGSADSRLSDWLDPLGTGAWSVDTLGGGLSVSPAGIVLSQGPRGGPFTNDSTVYTLSNMTASSLDWVASLGAGAHLRLDGGSTPIGGTLGAGAMTSVTVTLAGTVDDLKPGSHASQVVFEDLTNALTTTRTHVVEVGRVVAHDFPMDANPGWTMQSEWAFGVPLGNVGGYGEPDPTSGATGANVLGFDLAGTYPNEMTQQHLTTTALDCSGLTGTKVRFQRWLNVEQPQYDHAYFKVSTNGVIFTTLWENGAEITDTSWQTMEFDLSAIADGQPTVYLRWTMGSTDESWDYTGWNIDDVQVSGFEQVIDPRPKLKPGLQPRN